MDPPGSLEHDRIVNDSGNNKKDHSTEDLVQDELQNPPIDPEGDVQLNLIEAAASQAPQGLDAKMTEAGTEAGTQAGTEARTEARTEVTTEAATEIATEATAETSTEATKATTEAATEAMEGLETIQATASVQASDAIHVKPIEDSGAILGTSQAESTASVESSSKTYTSTSVRFSQLEKVVDRSLEAAIKHLNYQRLASCYPTIASTDVGKGHLNQALKEIGEFWQSTAEREFKAIFKERDLEQKLTQLESLIEDARIRQRNNSTESKVQLAELTPDIIVKAHLKPVKQAEIARLQATIDLLGQENETLVQSCDSLQNEIGVLTQEIVNKLDALGNAVNSLQGLPKRSQMSTEIAAILDSNAIS